MTKIESLPVGIVSWLHIPEEDWDLLCEELTVGQCSLSSDECEAYIDFDWVTENESVRITLGRVFAELEDDRALDYDVYLIMREAGFSSHFCELVYEARRAGMDYLIIDIEKDPTPELLTFPRETETQTVIVEPENLKKPVLYLEELEGLEGYADFVKYSEGLDQKTVFNLLTYGTEHIQLLSNIEVSPLVFKTTENRGPLLNAWKIMKNNFRDKTGLTLEITYEDSTGVTTNREGLIFIVKELQYAAVSPDIYQPN